VSEVNPVSQPGAGSIVTSEAVVLDFNLAGVGSRSLARTLDTIIQYIAFFIIALIAHARQDGRRYPRGHRRGCSGQVPSRFVAGTDRDHRRVLVCRRYCRRVSAAHSPRPTARRSCCRNHGHPRSNRSARGNGAMVPSPGRPRGVHSNGRRPSPYPADLPSDSQLSRSGLRHARAAAFNHGERPRRPGPLRSPLAAATTQHVKLDVPVRGRGSRASRAASASWAAITAARTRCANQRASSLLAAPTGAGHPGSSAGRACCRPAQLPNGYPHHATSATRSTTNSAQARQRRIRRPRLAEIEST